jgi:hypothetical protein
MKLLMKGNERGHPSVPKATASVADCKTPQTIKKSSFLLPAPTSAFSQQGILPRPVHVSMVLAPRNHRADGDRPAPLNG